MYQHTAWVNLKGRDVVSPMFDIMQSVCSKHSFKSESEDHSLLLSQQLPMCQQFSSIKTVLPQWLPPNSQAIS